MEPSNAEINVMAEPDLITGADSIIVVPDILYGDDSLRRTKILIIDDEPRDVRFLERILRRVRIENFRSKMDSASALSLFKEFQPDLVLIDWLMADVNGRTVVEQLRAMIPAGGFVPIVVLIADMTPGTRQLALASGANELIAKPIDACEVVLRISNMVQVRLAHLRLSEQKQSLEETVRQRTFDLKQALAELRSSQQRLALTQRMSAVGTMASGIAHDFNNAAFDERKCAAAVERYSHCGPRCLDPGGPTSEIFQIGGDRRSASTGRPECGARAKCFIHQAEMGHPGGRDRLPDPDGCRFP
jgi:DNA-binding response OmpR family regulator